MIVDERIITFINSMDTENSEILETIEQEALASDVPIIRREMQSFLEVLLLMKKPMRVLEVGTAVGFSALLMSDYLPEGGHITTIENYPSRIERAKANIALAGMEDKITLIAGDAAEVLKGHKLAQGVRGIVSPATPKIYKMAVDEGLIDIFLDAGFCVTNPTCGACLGMSNGVLANGEVCASTTNRNFNGRMGKGGMVHLMSPATAAATAIAGTITNSPLYK